MKAAFSPRAFPWVRLLLIWVGIVSLLVVAKRQAILSGSFADTDDIMRLLQVRDLLAGQSWFDLTQHRIAPPGGLAMHWSRLVDIPLLLVIAPLSGLVGAARAEMIAGVVAPALALLVMLGAALFTLRRLFGPGREFMLIVLVFLLTSPIVIIQYMPTRIDHHGWQMASATVALAALLDRKAVRSGMIAGIALACYLAISIEGLPFAAGACGAAGLLWALSLDGSPRFPALMASLAGGALLCFAFASAADWLTAYCDALAPGHLLAFAAAALIVVGGARSTAAQSPSGRIAILGLAGVAALAGLAGIAPQCLGSPFGTMDPVVRDYWYLNVVEGLPFWRQVPVAATEMIVFPLIGVVGSIAAALNARSPETRRRWMTIAIVCGMAAVTGMMVRRAAGVATISALPGAFAIMLWLRAWLAVHVRPQLGALAGAVALVGLGPLAPPLIVAGVEAGVTPAQAASQTKPTQAVACDADCALLKMAALRPALILTGVDAGPRVIAVTKHRVVSAGYHRLQEPMRRTIDAFSAPPDKAEALVRATGAAYVMVAPEASELVIARNRAPNGLMARLAAGKTPPWLSEVSLGSPELRLYRVRD